MRRPLYPILSLLLLSLVLTGATAQEKPKNQPKPPQTTEKAKPEQPAEEEDPYVKRFEQLDRDKDGYVSIAEWPLDKPSYNLVDRNQDGRLSRIELLTPNTLRRNHRFRQLDLNGDGRLSRPERQRIGTGIDAADRNKDGFVTIREYDESRNFGNDWNPRATLQDQQRFQLLDRDRDNLVTRPEWTPGGATFDEIDRNRDGVITPSEWPK